jgi:hypothetical protein
MRRIGLGVFVLAMAVVATACPGVPQGYWPPKVESYEVSPQPVHPGETVTITADVVDDRGLVSGFARRLMSPSGTWVYATQDCTYDAAPQGSFEHVRITVTCPVPSYASNGTWKVEVRLNDGSPLENLPGAQPLIPFEVTGGNDDRSAPTLVQYSTEPATIDQETVFTLTARLRDDTQSFVGVLATSTGFAFVKPFTPNSVFDCRNPTYTPVSATDTDVTVTCGPSNYNVFGRSEPGLHRAFMPVYDSLNQRGNLEMTIDVQPKPVG